VNFSELDARRKIMQASAACEVLWELEGQAMDLSHNLIEVRDGVAERNIAIAIACSREVRDRIRVLLSTCDQLDAALAVDRLVSKCPE
jgi:hypothetical protein